MDVVAHYIQRFPFDSSTDEDAQIRGLHNSLQPKFGQIQKWIENDELIKEQRTSRPAAPRPTTGRVSTISDQMDELTINETRPPPDNIRQINIYPDRNELMKNDDDVYLRRNVVQGKV